MSDQPRHILVVSCLIRDPQERLLLVRHRTRGWEMPQGRVEEGEALIFALCREVLEETGVTIAHARLEAVWSKVSSPSAVIFGFSARYASGEPTASDETPEVAWFSAAEARQRMTHPVNRERLNRLLQASGGVRFHSYQTSPFRVLS